MVAHASEGLIAQPMVGMDALPGSDGDRARNVDEINVDKNCNVRKDTRPDLPKVDDFRRAIPAHCFERSLVRSMRYLVQDFAILGLLYYTVPYFEQYGGIFGYFVWNCLFGVFGFALFVVGHDCLHGSFSEYQWLNDIIGHIAFAPIFAPYFPWQKSHKTHHTFTNHIEKDMGHPWTQEKHYETWSAATKYILSFPLIGWFKWFPIYTLFGYCDGSHFYPFSRLFKNNTERIQCVISGLSCLACAYVAFALCDYSYFNFFKYYCVPMSFYGLMLGIVTYLQHTDEQAEIYEHDEWSFVRGQTQTIDRTYGFGLDLAMHNITDAHVVHHFFNKIPHYHLVEATAGIKKVLEPYAGTQYGYKSEINYDFFTRYLWYNIKLDYLVYKAKGILQYRTGKEANDLAAKAQ